MFYSAFIRTLSRTVQPIVSRATTSHEIWMILANTYGKPSRGHVKQLKQQLKRISKGNKFMKYMRNIITKADQLTLLASPLDHEDLLDVKTDGLGNELVLLWRW